MHEFKAISPCIFLAKQKSFVLHYYSYKGSLTNQHSSMCQCITQKEQQLVTDSVAKIKCIKYLSSLPTQEIQYFFITFLISGCGNVNKTIKGETRSVERERKKKSTKYRDGGKYYLHLQRCVTGSEVKKKENVITFLTFYLLWVILFCYCIFIHCKNIPWIFL